MNHTSLDELIALVAQKNEVGLKKDDPILIMHTINQKLLNDTLITQQQLLDNFRSEIAKISEDWGEDSKKKAEKIISVAIAESKQNMEILAQENAKNAAREIQEGIGQSVQRIKQSLDQAKMVAYWNMTAAIGVFFTVVLLLLRWLK